MPRRADLGVGEWGRDPSTVEEASSSLIAI